MRWPYLGVSQASAPGLDKDVKRLVRLAENLVGMESPGLKEAAAAAQSGQARPYTCFRGAIHLYVGQIMTLAFHVSCSSSSPSSCSEADLRDLSSRR